MTAPHSAPALTTWIVQGNLGGRKDVEAIEAACRRLDRGFVEVEAIPFSDELPQVEIDGPAICYGSALFVAAALRQGRWRPGAFFDEATFAFSAWREPYAPWLLNGGARLTTLGALAQELGPDDEPLFVRPDDDLKSFAGCVMTRGDLRQWAARLDDAMTVTPATPVVAASPRQIDQEWRMFMVDGRCVAGSRYRRAGRQDVAEGVPAQVAELAGRVAATWQPSPVFVLDVAQCQGELSIVEINGFNSAGFYASDVEAIVAAVSARVEADGGA